MWTTPRTDWQPNEVVDADDMNAIGANLAALKSPPHAQITLNESADYTTSATTFVDVDPNRLSAVITTHGGDVLVTFSGAVFTDSSSNVYFDITVDGIRIAGDDGLLVVTTTSTNIVNASFSFWIKNVTAAAHTFRLQWKVSAGIGKLWAGSGAASADIHPQFRVQEVS